MFAWTMAILAFTSVLIPGEASVSDKFFENCDLLGNRQLQVSWTVKTADSMVDFELCGCDVDRSTKAANVIEYMGFGLSGSSSMAAMVGADVVIAYVDTEPRAIDYYLNSKDQCREGVGACPDTLQGCNNDISSISGFRKDGFQCVAFSRPFAAGDNCDKPIDVSNMNQYIVWGIGSVEETAFKHFPGARGTASDSPIHLGRSADNKCSAGLMCLNCPAFTETVMNVTSINETFVANMGPPGGYQGYLSITGQAAWGMAWYLNETLVPQLIVQRGNMYTFISEGGIPSDGSNYHPFYITDSKSGGREKNTAAQILEETVFAGYDGDTPIGVGPYCGFSQSAASGQILNECGNQSYYVSSLIKNNCTSSTTPGRFTWTPDDTTPNVVYYQCATHRNLGYKITVLPRIDGGHRTEATLTLVLLVAGFLCLIQIM